VRHGCSGRPTDKEYTSEVQKEPGCSFAGYTEYGGTGLLLNRVEHYGVLEKRNRVLMSLVVYQAFLPQEMEAVTNKDLNLEAGEIYIRPTPKTKGRTLPPKPVHILLFYAYVQDEWAEFGGRRVNAQVIRQSVITNLLKAGHDLRVVQMFAGHKSSSSTEKYRQEGVETLKAAVGKYHPFEAGILNQ
jgi:integrase/recombinase XerD